MFWLDASATGSEVSRLEAPPTAVVVVVVLVELPGSVPTGAPGSTLVAIRVVPANTCLEARAWLRTVKNWFT